MSASEVRPQVSSPSIPSPPYIEEAESRDNGSPDLFLTAQEGSHLHELQVLENSLNNQIERIREKKFEPSEYEKQRTLAIDPPPQPRIQSVAEGEMLQRLQRDHIVFPSSHSDVAGTKFLANIVYWKSVASSVINKRTLKLLCA